MNDELERLEIQIDEDFAAIEAESRGGEPGVEDSLGDEDAPTPAKYTITSYGSDPTVEVLVSRMRGGNYFVPKFQRGYVWSLQRASSFIESLLLGLPVPGIFLCKEVDGSRYLIIDGQQRLKSLQYFFDGVFEPTGKEFALVGVTKDLNGRTFRKLEEGDRITLQDSVVHATIIKQDDPKEEEMSSIYHVFKRINAGAVPLTPQEIRFCISNGSFTDLVMELNAYPQWRELYGPISRRMKDQELILRFFAMTYRESQYSRPMADFLDNYLHLNRKLPEASRKQLAAQFRAAVDVVAGELGGKALRPDRALNVAVYDSVMTAISQGIDNGRLCRGPSLKEAYERLLKDDGYVFATSRATADEANVKARFGKAREFLWS